MNDFWNNISRYPRFFISSLIGLILVILAPFQNLFKIPKLRIFLLLSFVGFTIFFYLILKNMAAL
jgi:hypothetical protein